MPLRTFHYGIGAIGAALAREALNRPSLLPTGAVDADRAKTGLDLGEVVGAARPLGVRVQAPEDGAWPEADVALHATGSSLRAVLPQIEACVERGLHVVSSCEELSFPYERFAAEAARLDTLARARGVTVLATGVNPGFVMDTLPLALSAASCTVESISVTRVLDAALRRLPFQQKVGAGLSPEDFAKKASGGYFGHIGLAESALAIAAAFGWLPNEIEDSLEPVIATGPVTSPHLSVSPGQVAGLHQVLALRHAGRVVITMDLVMAMGAADPRDEVLIRGDPPVHNRIEGGLHGDRATVGIMLNAARAVMTAPRGLITMLDIPLLHWSGSAQD